MSTADHPSNEDTLRAALRHIERLEARLARLEAAQRGGPDADDHAQANRRGFLKLAGAMAVTAVGAGTLNAAPAAALDGSAILQGQVNTGQLETGVVNEGTGAVTTAALKGTGPSNSNGLWGVSLGALGAGVTGESDVGYGVYGVSASGYPLFAAGSGRIGMSAHVVTGPPSAGAYVSGDVIRDSQGAMWVCVTGGSPGTWRKVAGPTSAGQLHVLPSPVRAYDSRPSQVPSAAPQGGEGPFASGTARNVDLSLNATGGGPLVPVGATAAVVTVSVFSITAEGFMTLYRSGTVPASTINVFWGNLAGNQTAATTIVALSEARQFSIRATLANGPSVAAAIDVVGYYL
jgi:hypothetical protein